jgi:hypothetical protein
VDDPCDGITTISLEGKLYNVVSIGAQCWMKENLNVGTMINDSLEMTNQGVLEKYCYENNENNCDEFGGTISVETKPCNILLRNTHRVYVRMDGIYRVQLNCGY